MQTFLAGLVIWQTKEDKTKNYFVEFIVYKNTVLLYEEIESGKCM